MNAWRSEINRLVTHIAIGAGLGWLVGQIGWGIALLLGIYHLRALSGARQLAEWVLIDRNGDPPDSGTVWGALYDHLYQTDKQHQTRMRALQEMVEKGRQSTNALRDAIVVVNPAGELDWWNDATQRLFGFRRDTDRGQPITNLVRDPRFVRYFRQRAYDQDLEIPSPVQRTIMLSIQIVVFGDNNRLLVARDITRLHNLEQTRKDFVANVSHELRTPLTVIKGYLDTFADMVDPNQKAMARGVVQMQEQAERMEMLVSDLLLLSRLETQANRQPAAAVNVVSLLERIHQDALAHNGESRHELLLDISSNAGISGQENELHSAFSNIVMNAMKYTPPGGRIVIRWASDDEGASFSVEDNGTGIEEQHIPRLTERFYRADASRNSRTGGTGLGLAIVKHVLLHHDARLDIRSTPGKGSTFLCRFPAKCVIPVMAG